MWLSFFVQIEIGFLLLLSLTFSKVTWGSIITIDQNSPCVVVPAFLCEKPVNLVKILLMLLFQLFCMRNQWTFNRSSGCCLLHRIMLSTFFLKSVIPLHRSRPCQILIFSLLNGSTIFYILRNKHPKCSVLCILSTICKCVQSYIITHLFWLIFF